MTSSRGKTLLVISQVFVPDPASVGQHVADVAFEMARRGHRVRVYASARGYENPSIRYEKREMLQGVEIRRFGFASFGKKYFSLRVLGTLSFMFQAMWVCLTMPNLGGIFFSTSPPMIGVAALLAKWFRGVHMAYWAMDLNPDQLIALGAIKEKSLTARALESANRMILRGSSLVVALDRFMADRLRLRAKNLDQKMLIAPPWPHESHLEPLAHADNPFRARHNLADNFVIMYSGNHSPSHPLHTLLEAAERLKAHSRLKFLFVGGGLGKREVESFAKERSLANITSLPYQPLADLRFSLSAADVHVVALGDNMVGIVHPCKIYGAMAVGRPILFLGPRPSHISDILAEHDFGRQISHGDVDAAVKAIEFFMSALPDQLAHMGQTAQGVLTQRFTQAYLCGQFCDRLEDALRLGPARTQSGNVDAPQKTAPIAAAD